MTKTILDTIKEYKLREIEKDNIRREERKKVETEMMKNMQMIDAPAWQKSPVKKIKSGDAYRDFMNDTADKYSDLGVAQFPSECP